MARYTSPKCKLCRRDGVKLYLKGTKCYTSKCPLTRSPTTPGQHSREHSAIKLSDYGKRLREHQKLKRIYGILERQFRRYFELARRQRGNTAENLLVLLERRLDNVVYRLGFAISRAQARQLVSHKHFLVNSKRVNIPSYLVKPGDIIELKDKELQAPQEALQEASKGHPPAWLSLDLQSLSGKVLGLPTREQIDTDIEEQLVVEYYSR